MRAPTLAFALLLAVHLAAPASALASACANPVAGVAQFPVLAIRVPSAGPLPPSCTGPGQIQVSNNSAPCPPVASPTVFVDVLCGPLVPPGATVHCTSSPGIYNNLVLAIDVNANGIIDPLDVVNYDTLDPVAGHAAVKATAPVPARYIATAAAGLPGSTFRITCA